MQRLLADAQFLSTLSLRRATRGKPDRICVQTISIHALLAESDLRTWPASSRRRYFYPRSPCGERQNCRAKQLPQVNFYPRSPCGERRCRLLRLPRLHRFLSTLSLRRATRPARCNRRAAVISIHALLAESDACQCQTRGRAVISIHALLAESDWGLQPKAPTWPKISIHALLAESDGNGLVFLGLPQGFLSTLSLRRATAGKPGRCRTAGISIHALLAESDRTQSQSLFA